MSYQRAPDFHQHIVMCALANQRVCHLMRHRYGPYSRIGRDGYFDQSEAYDVS